MTAKAGRHLLCRMLFPLTPREGVTLIEMLVSVAIFSVLTLLSIGSMLAVMNARAKATVIKDVVDNARFTLELMTRELRTGKNYQIVSPLCVNQIGSGLQFTSYNQGSAQERFYYLHDTDSDGIGDAIWRVVMPISGAVDCALARQFTSEEIIVDQLFYIMAGAGVGPTDGQPRMTISIRTHGKNPKYGKETSIHLQTTVTQRARDN